MPNAKENNSYKKLWLYFTLLFIIPGIILGFLAFRGIQNDQAIIEKQKRIELQRQSDQLISTLRYHLDSLVNLIESAEGNKVLSSNRNLEPFIHNILAFE